MIRNRSVRNRSVPASAVIPVLSYPDVPEAAEWLCRAFGFRVRLRIGGHRVQLVHGDGAVILTDAGRGGDGAGGEKSGGLGAGHSIHVRVEDADAHHGRAVAVGAGIAGPPADYEFGERQYTAEDPWGHRWTFSQSIADVDPAIWGGELVIQD